jgi:hypothetical protein
VVFGGGGRAQRSLQLGRGWFPFPSIPSLVGAGRDPPVPVLNINAASSIIAVIPILVNILASLIGFITTYSILEYHLLWAIRLMPMKKIDAPIPSITAPPIINNMSRLVFIFLRRYNPIEPTPTIAKVTPNIAV